MFEKSINFLIIAFAIRGLIADEKNEISCNINGKRAINYVSEKFLSISIDPAVLLAGVNLSESSLRLANHLTPAFIRIAGPSTEFVKYVDTDFSVSPDELGDDESNVVVTPSMWFGISEWLRLAGLTPIFGVNDKDTAREVWNPKSVLPLLELTDKLNVSCYWQLGFDSSNKSDVRYKQDLGIFQLLLAAFPERNETWKIVGSDISTIPVDRIDSTLDELRDIATAVMWEPTDLNEDSFPDKGRVAKILQNNKQNMKIWTTVPKSNEPPTFSSALRWAKQIGRAAKLGYDVVFRQPRMYEFFNDSPVYWFSLLHKKLMGSNVLEAKTSNLHQGTSVFAHCTRKQNSFVRRGAMTVMIVNDHEEAYNVKVKLGITQPDKTMEVQSYIMTSTSLNSTELFLNGELLTVEVLARKDPFEPKLRRAKTSSYIALSVPPYSVGFFVLPGARVPVCIELENETDLLLEEIEQDQNGPLSQELALQFVPRGSFNRNHILEEITRQMKDEMKEDGNYYQSYLKSQIDDIKLRFKDEPKEKEDSLASSRKHFIERAKLLEKRKKNTDLEKKRDELKKFLIEKTKIAKTQPKMELKSKDLDLTSNEVEKILKERAQARAAQRNIVFTDEELDALIQKASKKFYKAKIKRDINMNLLRRKLDQDDKRQEDKQVSQKTCTKRSKTKRSLRMPRDINMKILELKSKLAETKQKMENKKYDLLGNARTIKDNFEDKVRQLKSNSNRRFRRDINMDLLKTKTDKMKKPKDKEVEFIKARPVAKADKEATIREPGQTSDAFSEEYEIRETEEEKPTEKTEIIAEMADSDYGSVGFFESTTKSGKAKLFDKKAKIDPFAIVNPSIEIVGPTKKNKKNKKKSKSEDALQFLTSSEEFTDIEEDYPCIHEYFGNEFDSNKKPKGVHELGELSSEEKLKRSKSQKKKKVKKIDSDEDYDDRRKRNVSNKEGSKSAQGEYENDMSNSRDKRDAKAKKSGKSEKDNKKSKNEDESSDGFGSLQEDMYGDLDMLGDVYDFRRKREEGSKKSKATTKKTDKKDDEKDKGSSDLESLLGDFDEDSSLGVMDEAYYFRRKRNEPGQIVNVSKKTVKATNEDRFDRTRRNSGSGNYEFNKKNYLGDNLVAPNNIQGEMETTSKSFSLKGDVNELIVEENTLKKPERNMESFELLDQVGNGATLNSQKATNLDIKNDGQKLSQSEKQITEAPRPRVFANKNIEISTTGLTDHTPHKQKQEIVRKIDTLNSIKENLNILKNEVGDRLEEMKSLLIQDKLKLGEEKVRNRLQILDIDKPQKSVGSDEADGILGKVHRSSGETHNEVYDQLRVLKKKMEQKKDELGTLLMKSIKENQDVLEKQTDSLLKKHIGENIGKDLLVANLKPMDTFTLESRIKSVSEKLREAMKNAFQQPPKIKLKANIDGIKDTININSKNADGVIENPSKILTKRSLFDTKYNIVGRYKPLTIDMETTEPTRASHTNTVNKMNTKKKPPNDFQVFRQLSDRNRMFNLRKRSIDDSENELDSNLNYIEKESKHAKPKTGTYYEYTATTEKYVEVTNRTEAIDDIEKTTLKDNVKSKKISNVQKITRHDEPKGLQAFFSSVTGFLAKLGRQIENYVKNISDS